MRGAARRIALIGCVLGLAGSTLSIAIAAPSRMPTESACAHGATPVSLGRHVGSAAVCAGVDGHTAAYLGGNALYPCGQLTVADQQLLAGDANACDRYADDPLDLHVYVPQGVPTRGLPSVYLLSGSGGSWDMWPDMGFNPQGMADRYRVVVIAVGGQTTFYVNWVDGKVRAEDQFLHIVRNVDAAYGTSQNRNQRALVGLSMGGYGATLLGERHADLFGNVVSMSGINDIQQPYVQANLIDSMLPLNHYSSPAHVNRVWGTPEQSTAWSSENPQKHVCGLRSSWIWFSSGDGVPSKADVSDVPFVTLAAQTETTVRASNDTFAQALRDHGLRFTYRTRHGVHNSRYWLNDAHEFLPTLMNRLATAAPSPQPAHTSC
jgi:S-formylglutathione hydrolase FrmB